MGVFFCPGGYAARWRAALFPKLVGREQRPVGLESFPQFLRELWNDGGEAGFIPSFLLLLGERHLAGWLFLFVVKKEPKNRHRFEAVDADQGCGPGPGECGHLTTA